MISMPKPKTILGIMFVVFVAAYAAAIFRIHAYYIYGDTYFHLGGGVLAALLVASYYHSEFEKLSPLFRLFALMGITMGIGVLWEFHEFILGGLAYATHNFGGHVSAGMDYMGDLRDTMKDLCMDTLGGLIVGLWLFRIKKQES